LTSAEALRVNNGWRQLEEGMNRLAADVERGDPGGSQHDRGFRCLLPHVVQAGRFPSPGLAREEHTVALALNEVQGKSKLVRHRDLREIRRSVRHAKEGETTRGWDRGCALFLAECIARLIRDHARWR